MDVDWKHTVWAAAACFVALVMAVAWVATPSEWVFEVNTDNNTLRTAEVLERSTGYNATLACLHGCYVAVGYVSGDCYVACTADEGKV